MERRPDVDDEVAWRALRLRQLWRAPPMTRAARPRRTDVEPQVGVSVAVVSTTLTGVNGDWTTLGAAEDIVISSTAGAMATGAAGGAGVGSGWATGIAAGVAAGIARVATRRTEAFDLLFAALPLSTTDATAAHASIAAAPAPLMTEPPSGATGCAWMGDALALATAPRGAATGLPKVGPAELLTNVLPAL